QPPHPRSSGPCQLRRPDLRDALLAGPLVLRHLVRGRRPSTDPRAFEARTRPAGHQGSVDRHRSAAGESSGGPLREEPSSLPGEDAAAAARQGRDRLTPPKTCPAPYREGRAGISRPESPGAPFSPVSCQRMRETGIMPAELTSSKKRRIKNAFPSCFDLARIRSSSRHLPVM